MKQIIFIFFNLSCFYAQAQTVLSTQVKIDSNIIAEDDSTDVDSNLIVKENFVINADIYHTIDSNIALIELLEDPAKDPFAKRDNKNPKKLHLIERLKHMPFFHIKKMVMTQLLLLKG